MPGNNQLFLGLDIGGTKCAAVIGRRNGEILARSVMVSHASRGPEQMLLDLFSIADKLASEFPGVVAVGAAIGGPLDAERGIVLSPPNLPGWDRVPLLQKMQDHWPLPARVEHDAAACCLAEHHWGRGIGKSRLVYLTCGTGFGAGIVIDGKIYRGAGGKSVEIGHARFRDQGPDAFGKTGSVEAYCAGASLGKLAAWKFSNRWPSPPPAEELADLWRRGDSDAAAVIEINARAVGEVCANLGDTFRPDMILLGSLASHLGDKWVEIVRAAFRAEALADTAQCAIEPAGLRERLQDCSALVTAVSAISPAP